MKTAKNHNIHARVASLGYCCVRGYLLDCAIAGQSAAEAMAPLHLNRVTFYHHAQKVKNGTHACQGKNSCLFPEPAPQRPSPGGGHNMENLCDVGASTGGGLDSPGADDGNGPRPG